MTIAVLPARLANQIAAGEVVERPASVIKELVENSIDAGATKIDIDVEKGGSKRIKITDNGIGIVKDELTLALSRHATSKIKNLDDLESIDSLGFRGEALASISSVARLTLTSMPADQDSAWQAIAYGRDMKVELKPAAHPQGTTIDVEDLFFNTPARRKFLRTEKTEFTHIDEVVRRIALSQLQLTITLTHNGKVVRQYRSAKTDKQVEKRIASICGQGFIDNAIAVEFNHENLHLWGWIATPEFYRSQNDLCYSYVNGRMMRDKLINHAIRQAYGERLAHDGYPAFVLFLNLDFADVDVNVHPAKHEVRFHQARFVHDFICSAISTTLDNNSSAAITEQATDSFNQPHISQPVMTSAGRDYVQPLRENIASTPSPSYVSTGFSHGRVSAQSQENYQALMTPIQVSNDTVAPTSHSTAMESQLCGVKLLTLVANFVALIEVENTLYCLPLKELQQLQLVSQLTQSFEKGIVSQPLLLPISLTIVESTAEFIAAHLDEFERYGIVLELKSKQQCVIRQYPAQLRDKDINNSFSQLIELLMAATDLNQPTWITAFAKLKLAEDIDLQAAQQLLLDINNISQFDLFEYISLNSVAIDLTSITKQFN